MNLGYIGDKGQGKSYMLMKLLRKTLRRNFVWHTRKNLPLRKVAVMETLGLSEDFKHYWQNYLTFFREIDDLKDLRECDVFVDDISMRLDSRSWEMLTQGAREWLYGSERLGCDLYFTAQKFSRVEITFRLLTDAVFMCTKGLGSKRPSATKPAVKHVWGFVHTLKIPKAEYQAEGFNQDLYHGGFPHWLSRKIIECYDHTNISLSEGYPPLQCVEREAPCGKLIHVHK